MPDPDASTTFLWRLLIESLTALAAGAGTQRAWLEEHGVGPDELALDFDHAWRCTKPLAKAGRLGIHALARLTAIDSVFAAMSGARHADRWSMQALAPDPGWREVRELSRQVLVDLVGAWQLPMTRIRVAR